MSADYAALMLMQAAPLFAASSKTSTATASIGALHPLTYLPFHLASHHLTARNFSAKKFTYPAHLLFTLVQYAIEHFSAEFPSVAALGAILVPIAISMAPITYYCAYKKTTGPKWHIWAAVAIFLVTLPLFKGLELGFPRDDPTEQAQANLDPTHSYWHLVLHVVILLNGILTTYHVPWSAAAAKPAKLVKLVETPASPKARTLPSSSWEYHRSVVDDACSSPKRKAGLKAAWDKLKAA